MNKRVKKVGMLEEWKKKETLQEENALASHACRTKEFQEKDSRLPLHDCFSRRDEKACYNSQTRLTLLLLLLLLLLSKRVFVWVYFATYAAPHTRHE
jgi:hypothetical protein